MAARSGNGARGPGSAVLAVAGALVLSGCAGFLVPAGEGEPGPTPSRAAATAPSGIELPPDPPAPPTADAPARGYSPTPTAQGDCPASGVRVDMGQVETAMFHRAVVLTLTNCGGKPYPVNGYPSVQALGEDGERLPVKVNPGGSYFGPDPGAEPVTLKPGAVVRSTLAWVSTQEGGDLVEGDALEIAAAPDTGARVFPLVGHDVRLMDELNMTAWRVRESN
ncbi:DUF4232 domain-containing protein [Streptomyces finlayi]|uniref:DUF4232 domain-containing protein n=1 Tax=Streptomyces finlayi TaxID=67296 RepID=A0A7G7BRV5_9ACTN|nr:DUF4232 domain-containing protein [Streptomyces finlayi]QNE78070.1 DUF4232 domain-containing protein [Streptomyces finlayi]